MAQVTVRINGYNYVLGCEDGQEAHLGAMADQVETRINSIKAMGGQNGEAKLLVLAALLMADELHDLKVDGSPGRGPSGKGGEYETEAGLLTKLANRAESIATELERP
jgi:cell division protein ZapA